MKIFLYFAYVLLLFGKDCNARHHAHPMSMQHGHKSISKIKTENRSDYKDHHDDIAITQHFLLSDQDSDKFDFSTGATPFVFNSLGICFQMQAILFMLQSDGKDDTDPSVISPALISQTAIYIRHGVLLI